MSHRIGVNDRDLHWPDGTHRTTPASANDYAVTHHPDRLVHHLAGHAADAEIDAARLAREEEFRDRYDYDE